MRVTLLRGRSVHDSLGPFKRSGGLLVGLHEAVDRLTKLANRRATQISESLTAQNAKPDLDHIEPGRVGGDEMKMHLGVPGQPTILFGLVRVEIVQNDV